jgi:peptide-methionine (S)-S-oxide reductase
MAQKEVEIAVLGMGCFWCTEAVFQELRGVISVEPGYTGGERPNPTYEQVSTGVSGHVEVARVKFDPEIINFKEILDVFWRVHDPTTLNRQGNDEGEQYRSVIFYADESQKNIAESSKIKIRNSQEFTDPIVTTIEPLKVFYPAEDYHKNYFANNPNAGYCQVIIRPKVDKVRKLFRSKLKNGSPGRAVG